MPNRSRRVAAADADPVALLDTVKHLGAIGHDVLLAVASLNDLANHRDIDLAELIVADINVVPSGGPEAVAQFLQLHDVPLIITSGTSTDEAIDLANACRPLACLVKPIWLDDLRAATAIAVQRFEELRILHSEAQSLRDALHDRKIIEQAKGVIMQQLGLSEVDAFTRLQRLARDKRMKLSELAQSIIIAGPALK